MRIEERRNATVAYLCNTRIFDELLVSKTGDEIDQLVNNVLGKKRLVLDFSSVEFMSSAMIGRLVLVNKAAKAANRDLRLRNICPWMMKVFRLTRLNKLFKIGEGNYGEENDPGFVGLPLPAQQLADTVSPLRP